MLEDKIQHNLIKIKQLCNENESIRYIIPLYFNAIKCIHDNCAHYKIDAFLIEQVVTKFRSFEEERQEEMNKLDQVHLYMLEECSEMIQAKHFQSKSQIKKSKIFSKIVENDASYLKEEELIFLPQEQYYYDKQFNSVIHETPETANNQPYVSKSNIIRPISLDGVPVFSHSTNDVSQSWDKLEILYKEHRLDQAYQQCEKFQNTLFLYDPNCKLPQYKHDLIEKIHEEYKMMTMYYECFNEPNYTFDKAEKGVSMFCKINKESREVSVRVEAELDISIQNFMCIVSQVDLFQEFVPFAYDTRVLKNMSRNQKIGLTRVYVPLLTNRQAYFYAAAYDRLKTHNSIFFFSKTISSDVEFQKKIGYDVVRDPELVELEYKFYIIEYCPIAHNRGKVRLATNIDMKLNFLPMFVINKSLRIFSFDYFKNLLKVNKNFQGSAWQKKMEQNKQSYQFFRQKIRQYLESEK